MKWCLDFEKKKVAFKNKLKKDIEKVVQCFIISMYLTTLSYCYRIADATPGVLALMVMILSCFLVVVLFFIYFIHS